MTRVFIHIVNGERVFQFVAGKTKHTVPIVGDHEFTLSSVDFLEQQLERLTGSRAYKPMYHVKRS